MLDDTNEIGQISAISVENRQFMNGKEKRKMWNFFLHMHLNKFVVSFGLEIGFLPRSLAIDRR